VKRVARVANVRRCTTMVVAVLACLSAAVVRAAADSDWVRAIVKRDLDRIAQLLPAVDDVDQCTADSRTALMLAAGEARPDLVRALLARGAAVNARNERGGTALMYAATAGDEKSVLLLLARGAEVNARARNGWTALTLASVRGFDPIVTELLASGADVNPPDIYGWTPLMRAVQAERLAVVRVLLANPRVDVNAVDENGQSALHHAAEQGAPEIAKLLLDHGARRDVRDRAGRTAHDIAVAAKHPKVAALLEAPRAP
jgi:ankyrin repeat protein